MRVHAIHVGRGGRGVSYNQLTQDIHRANMGILTFHFMPRGTVADIYSGAKDS